MAKNPKQKQVTIDEVTYILQHPGIRSSVQMRDRAKNNLGQFSEEKYYTELMKHVIVEPKVTWDYFDEHEGIFEQLMKEAAEFVNGVDTPQ